MNIHEELKDLRRKQKDVHQLVEGMMCRNATRYHFCKKRRLAGPIAVQVLTVEDMTPESRRGTREDWMYLPRSDYAQMATFSTTEI